MYFMKDREDVGCRLQLLDRNDLLSNNEPSIRADMRKRGDL